MAGTSTPSFLPKRRRGRHSSLARNFLAAVGQATTSSSSRNGNNNSQQQQQQQQQVEGVRTPKKPLHHASNGNTTPAAAAGTPSTTASSPSLYSPSLWSPPSTRRSSSTRSQQSGKTEPTLDTLESASTLMGSNSSQLRQAHPLQRTNQHVKPTTIYEHRAAATNNAVTSQQQHGNNDNNNTRIQARKAARSSPPSTPTNNHKSINNHHRMVMMAMESPSTPDADRAVYARPLFPATSPRGAQQQQLMRTGDVSDHSSLTNSTRSNPGSGRHQPATMMAEIRPTESYLTTTATSRTPPRTTPDSEQRTATSSITTHSTTPQHQRYARGGALEAHVQDTTRRARTAAVPQRQATEDWESVSTNEVGYPARSVAVQLPGFEGQTLGQSIDQGIDMIMGAGQRWVQCTAAAAPALPAPKSPGGYSSGGTSSSGKSPSSSSSRRGLHKANSSVSGASTEVATNRAVDLALKRVQEIETSRGTEQALFEARQALERLKDSTATPSSTPTVHTPQQSCNDNTNPAISPKGSPASGRLAFGNAPNVPEPKCEAKSILSDSTEEGGGSGGSSNSKRSGMKMVPVGRLEQKVHRLAQLQYGNDDNNKNEDGQHSLPNESLPSSIGVEVDSKGVAKSNPALRAVFEQHTLDSLRTRRGPETTRPTDTKTRQQQQQQHSPDYDAIMMDPALAAAYHPPPPPPNPPSSQQSRRNEVRKYVVNRGRPARPATSLSPQGKHHTVSSPDPIVCHGSYVSDDGGIEDVPDGADSSVVPTVFHPAHLMTNTSHDDSTVFSGLSPTQGGRRIVSTGPHSSTAPVPATSKGQREVPEKLRPVHSLARRWPPAPSPPRDVPDDEKEDDDAGNVKNAGGVFNLRSSPAWEARKRMQESQDQIRGGHPSPKPIGNRVSSIQQRLFAKPEKKQKSLDSFVVRKGNQEAFGAPSIDDTSIDLHSVRSAFESAQGSVDRFMAAQEKEPDGDSDDDTGSVKSLKERYEGSTGSNQKKESGISKYRAMFESKNKLPSKPFQGGTSELHQVFSRFQNSSRPLPRPKIRRQASDQTPRPEDEPAVDEEREQRVESARRLTDKERTEQDEEGARPIRANADRTTVADRIKVFGGNKARPPVPKQWNSASRLNGTIMAPAKQPKADPTGCNVVLSTNEMNNESVPSKPSPRPSPRGFNSDLQFERESSGSSDDMPNIGPTQPRASPQNIPDARKSLRPSVVPFARTHPNERKSDLKLNKSGAQDSAVSDKNTPRPRASPTTIDEARKFLRSSPGPVRKPHVAVQPDPVEIKVDEGKLRSPYNPISGELRSSPVADEHAEYPFHASHVATPFRETHASPTARSNRSETKPRSSPTTIEEARKALRASPVSQRPENTGYRSQAQTVMTEESQIEEEVAEITATGAKGGNKSVDTPVRKFDWFQRAAVEIEGMNQSEDRSTEYRPVTPLTPSRVQERVRMFSNANATVSGVRRPVPTPANFHAELREISKSRPTTPERQRLPFQGWGDEHTAGREDLAYLTGVDMQDFPAYHTPPNRSTHAMMRQDEIAQVEKGRQPQDTDEENLFRPQPRRIEATRSIPPQRGLVDDYGPSYQNRNIANINDEHGDRYGSGVTGHGNGLHDLGPPAIERTWVQDLTIQPQSATHPETARRKAGYATAATPNDFIEDPQAVPPVSEHEQTFQSSVEPSDRHSVPKQSIDGSQSPSDSEFSDGVTLDMSIADVSGLTVPTALISRPGAEISVATVEEEGGGDSEGSSKARAEVEAKRSEASSSQTSEALIPLLNRSLRQRPMSDEPSTGDSFFEARAIVANHWSKTSEMGHAKQRSVVKDFRKRQEANEDSSGGWDPARIESSFPVTPSNAGDLFDFESGWEAFSAKQSGEDPFRQTGESEEKKTEDVAARSTTPTRSNRGAQPGSYIDRRYPPLHTGPPMPSENDEYDSPKPNWGPLLAPSQNPENRTNDLPKTSSSFDADSENSPANPAIPTPEASQRLIRTRLARHSASRSGSEQEDLVGLNLAYSSSSHHAQAPHQGRATSFFGRTHPQTSDPTWEKNSYPSYDPTLPADSSARQEPKAPSWKPPVAGPTLANTTMQRYGEQHAALLARLRALKEARVRRANAIYARTSSVFPRQVEFDDHSLSTKSSTQFGGSHFMESLKVD